MKKTKLIGCVLGVILFIALVTVVNDYALSSNLLTFNIYVWLNGNSLTSINSDNQFIAKISADTTPITGEF